MFLESFGRELARQLWRNVLGLWLVAALLALVERLTRRARADAAAAEIRRMAAAVSGH